MKIVLDTNCLLPAVLKQSKYHWIWDAFRRKIFSLCYTTDILNEYEELLTRNYNADFAKIVLNEILHAPNIVKTTVYFKWNLILVDPDDNKFVDCALNGGAVCIVTNDKHFNALKNLKFPTVKIVDIETFKQFL
jgi:putative PIN family toxin of toxin-antitoxin system